MKWKRSRKEDILTLRMSHYIKMVPFLKCHHHSPLYILNFVQEQFSHFSNGMYVNLTQPDYRYPVTNIKEESNFAVQRFFSVTSDYYYYYHHHFI